jgi:hypothetical protein
MGTVAGDRTWLRSLDPRLAWTIPSLAVIGVVSSGAVVVVFIQRCLLSEVEDEVIALVPADASVAAPGSAEPLCR